MKKVILIHNIINPTRTQFFNELDKTLKDSGYSFKVLFNSKRESNRSWNMAEEIKKQKFEYMILKSKQIHLKIGTDNYYFHINKGLSNILDEENPDIIIHAGWASLSAWQALFRCKNNHKKFILWNESSKYEESRRRTITKPIVKYLVKKSDGYLSFGTRATEYLILLGASKDKICQMYNTVDIDFFINEHEKLKSKKEDLKKKYGIKTKYVLLYVGQLIKNKGIYEILDGFKKFQVNHPDWSLLFVGGGQEKENINNIIKEQNIKNVFLPGFFQKNQISELYEIGDVFTLPSKIEVWGLVINEAMCFGLPIITGYRVGASVDLVKEGENGYIMKEYTGHSFYEGLNLILESGLINKNSSRDIIKNFKISKIMHNIKKILNN